MPPVQVISLPRSAARRADFARRHARLPFEFFDAVDGAALSREAVAATGLFAPNLHYTAGAYGAALSHHALWTRAAAGANPLTIAEDDVIFRDDFLAAQEALLAGLLPGWDMVLWGWNFDSILALRVLPGVPGVMAFDPATVRGALAGFPFTTAQPQAFRLDAAFGLPAYTLSMTGAKKLLARAFPLSDFTRTYPVMPQPVRNDGIDTALTNIYPTIDAHVCFPPLAMTPNDRAGSTIQNGQYLAG